MEAAARPTRSRLRPWLRWIALPALALAVALGTCELWVSAVAAAECHESVTDVPRAPVALVLGCSETLPDGRDNLYFARRMDAAAELFHRGGVGHLIVSGDNHSSDYDEPTAMKAALVERGVPEERIHCDYAGFRTLDSVVRAELVFGQRSFVVVSQRPHAERAVFLARALPQARRARARHAAEVPRRAGRAGCRAPRARAEMRMRAPRPPVAPSPGGALSSTSDWA